MPDKVSADRFSLRRRFPALRILEAAGIALSPASVVIATVTWVLLGITTGLVDRILPIDRSVVVTEMTVETWPNTLKATPFIVSGDAQTLAGPWRSVVQPAVFALRTTAGTAAQLNGVIQFVLAIGVWSLVGIILCRRSAFLFAGNDESTVQRAVDYGIKRWATALAAPLIPLTVTLLIGISIAMLGLLGRLPFLGSIWLFVISPLAAIMGFAMAILLLATLFGWPLMIAAVSTDDCDSFGSLSRAYSGLTGRSWHAASYLSLSLLVGLVLTVVVKFVGDATTWCALSTVAFGCGDEAARGSMLGPLRLLVTSVESGVSISFSWSAASVIYLLLRQDVDGVPHDHIAADDADRPAREALPVVGIPATDSRVTSNGKVHSENG